MKNLVITVSIFMCSALSSTAQTSDMDPRERLTAGLKAGINNSRVWDEQGQDFRAEPRFGFAGGLFIGIPIGKFMGFQPEILISQKGFKGAGTLLNSAYSFSRVSTYIDIPLQLQIKPSPYLTVLVGPQYSYLMKEKNIYTYGNNSIEQEKEFENTNIRKNILGFVAGLDINIDHLVLSGRVGYDLQTNHGDGNSSIPRYKNQWLQFTVGFKL
jgi:hypothetical protein